MAGGRTQVIIGFASCDIQSVNYTHITCVTGAAGTWSGDITVSVLSNQDEVLTAVCAGDCTYSYNALSSPSLSDVTPTTVCGDEIID